MEETSFKQESLGRSAETLSEVSQELASWVPILRRLAAAEALRGLAFGQSFELTSEAIRTMIAARRLRAQYFGEGMSDEAWAIALELFANRLAGQRITIKGLGLAVDIPIIATVHCIDWLATRGSAASTAASDTDGSALVDLTDTGADQMRSYLIAALGLSPWVQ